MKATTTRKAKPAPAARKPDAPVRPAKANSSAPSMSKQLRELRESVDALNLHAECLLKQLQ